jgi:methionyl-tRNA formyltransferase
MRIVFAGTPDFAARSLVALIEAAPARGWSIPLVLSQPDRPAGRGMHLSASPVKALAQRANLAVATPVSLRKGDEAETARRQLAAAAPDVLVVAAYGLILPQEVLDIPSGLRASGSARVTAINVHASLLPRWRGARRSRERSRPVTRRPASRSCRWTPGSIPGRCFSRSLLRSLPTTPRHG